MLVFLIHTVYLQDVSLISVATTNRKIMQAWKQNCSEKSFGNFAVAGSALHGIGFPQMWTFSKRLSDTRKSEFYWGLRKWTLQGPLKNAFL